MPKLLVRLISLLLVTCLVTDPTIATGLTVFCQSTTAQSHNLQNSEEIQTEALAVASLVVGIYAWHHAPYLGRLFQDFVASFPHTSPYGHTSTLLAAVVMIQVSLLAMVQMVVLRNGNSAMPDQPILDLFNSTPSLRDLLGTYFTDELFINDLEDIRGELGPISSFEVLLPVFARKGIAKDEAEAQVKVRTLKTALHTALGKSENPERREKPSTPQSPLNSQSAQPTGQPSSSGQGIKTPALPDINSHINVEEYGSGTIVGFDPPYALGNDIRRIIFLGLDGIKRYLPVHVLKYEVISSKKWVKLRQKPPKSPAALPPIQTLIKTKQVKRPPAKKAPPVPVAATKPKSARENTTSESMSKNGPQDGKRQDEVHIKPISPPQEEQQSAHPPIMASASSPPPQIKSPVLVNPDVGISQGEKAASDDAAPAQHPKDLKTNDEVAPSESVAIRTFPDISPSDLRTTPSASPASHPDPISTEKSQTYLSRLKEFYKRYGRDGLNMLLEVSNVQLFALMGSNDDLTKAFMNGQFDDLDLAPQRIKKLAYFIDRVEARLQLIGKTQTLIRKLAPSNQPERDRWFQFLEQRTKIRSKRLKRFETTAEGLTSNQAVKLLQALESDLSVDDPDSTLMLFRKPPGSNKLVGMVKGRAPAKKLNEVLQKLKKGKISQKKATKQAREIIQLEPSADERDFVRPVFEAVLDALLSGRRRFIRNPHALAVHLFQAPQIAHLILEVKTDFLVAHEQVLNATYLAEVLSGKKKFKKSQLWRDLRKDDEVDEAKLLEGLIEAEIRAGIGRLVGLIKENPKWKEKWKESAEEFLSKMLLASQEPHVDFNIRGLLHDGLVAMTSQKVHRRHTLRRSA